MFEKTKITLVIVKHNQFEHLSKLRTQLRMSEKIAVRTARTSRIIVSAIYFHTALRLQLVKESRENFWQQSGA